MKTWLLTYWKQLAMIAIITAGYLVKKFAPLSVDELQYLDALWVVLGFGAVFTPNFAQSKPKELPPQ